MSAVEQHCQRKHEPMPPGGSVDSSSNGFPTSQSRSSSGNATTWDLYSMETPKQANRKKESAHSESQSQSEKSSITSGKSLAPIREKESRPQLEQQQQQQQQPPQQLLVKRSSEGLFPSLTHLLSFRRHDSYSRRSLEGVQPTQQANELDPPRVPNHITPPASVCSSDKKSSKQQIQKQRPHSWSSSSTSGNNNNKQKSHPTSGQRVSAPQVEDQQKIPNTMARDGGTPRSSPKTLQGDSSYRRRSMESTGSSTSSSHGMRVLEEMDRTIAARNSAYKRESASPVLSSSIMAGTILESKAKSPPGKPSHHHHHHHNNNNNKKDSPVAASPPQKQQHQQQRQPRQPIVLTLAPARASSLTNESNDGFGSPRSSANAERERFHDEGSPQPKRLVRDVYQNKQHAAVGNASAAEPKAKMQPQPLTAFARMPDAATERTTATAAAATLTANDTLQYGRRPDVQGLFAERLARKTAEERDRRNSTHAKRQKSNDHDDDDDDDAEQVSRQVFDRDPGEGERARLTGPESNASHHSDRHQEPHDIDDDGVGNAAESVEQTRPGAYAQRGRAYGEFPAWGRGRRAPPTTRHHDDASSTTSHSTNPVRWVWASLSRPSRVIRRLASLSGQQRSHQLPRAVNITTSVIEEGRSSHYETSQDQTSSRHGEENMRRSVEATATSLILPDKIVTESEHRRFRRCIVAGVAISLFFFLLTIGLLVTFLLLDTGILGINQDGEIESPPTSRLEKGSVVVFPTNAERLPPTICDEVQAAGSTNATIQPIVQCLCGYTSLVGGLTIDQINSYNNISGLVLEMTDAKESFPIKTMCTPESAAIWWLAEHQHRSLEAIRVRYALVMLFVSLRGLYWTDNSFWLTTRTVCEWEGIKCHNARLDSRGGLEGAERVAEIALFRQNLDGQLPEPGINLLSNLEMLLLNDNGLVGPLPATLPLSLKSLNLSGNQLRGVLPSWWSNLSVVQRLDVSSNPGLSGVIPTEWGDAVEAQSGLTRLQLLDLRNSIDGGSVPSALCAASSSNITIRIDCDVVVECPCCECA